MKRLYLARLLSILLLVLSILSCQSTGTLERIRDIEKLEGNARIEAYEKEIERNSAPELLYNKAYHELESGDTESAIATAEAALEEDPGFLRMRFLLLLSYREGGRRDEYLETLQEIASEIPYEREIQMMLLEEYREKHDYNRMVETAKWILEIDPKNEKALKALSYESEFIKDVSGMFDLEKIISELPEIETSSFLKEDEVMDTIRERYTLPFLFH